MQASMRPLLTRWLLAGLLALAPRAGAEELRTAAAVRELTVEQARQRLPVRLRGVVTFFNEPLFSRFIQDETAGIYLFDAGLPVFFQPGDVVEVEGVSSPGEYAPIVVPTRMTAVGRAPLPPAKPVSYAQLAGGREDSQFVEVSGIVRSVQLHEPSQHYQIEIATGGGRLTVFARELPVAKPENLPDSTVRVRGVCSTQFNHQRQLFAIRLMVPRPEDLVIVEPAPEDPFAIPARPLGSLLQFAPQESFGRRVKVAGTVICFRPGREIFLQEADQGIQVQTREKEPLQPGDQVEALGFVAQGEYTPVLQDAVYRRLRSGPPLVPAPLGIDEALQGKYDCRLIRVTGRLLDRGLHGADRKLILQNGNFIFNAHLPLSGDRDALAHLQNGSLLAVTGVCRIDPGEWEAGENWRARSFRLELRSPADIAVLASPPWWTLRRVLWMAGGLALVLLAAMGWVAVLHRQVAERTRALAAEIQERQRAERRREIEQERTRVAQDLHDELGAALTEVSMLGSLARTPEIPPAQKEQYLEQLTQVARNLVAILDEIVWAVNPKYDSVASLASYYSLFAQRFLNLAGIACRLRVEESLPDRSLDSRLRHGVFLAFREALNNAVRHSGAKEVRVELAVAGDELRVAVADDGRGFAADAPRPGSDGLAGMRDRMARLGGRCDVRSRPGAGTTVELRLPLGTHDS